MSTHATPGPSELSMVDRRAAAPTRSMQARRRGAPWRVAGALLTAVAAMAAGSAIAQSAAGDPAADAAGVVFERWLRVLEVVPVVPAGPAVVAVSPVVAPPVQAAPYEPWPVILGQPELPLVGAAAAVKPQAWPSDLNYQGMHVAYLVRDRQTGRLVQRPLSAAPRPGDRFKIRVTATFDARVRVDTVFGQGWSLQRGGTLYPATGAPVRARAAQAVDLPVERDHYFVVGEGGAPRMLLSVRHDEADESRRTRQPAYRQDQLNGTSYLQLAPAGTRPAIEQLITAAR
jgi:hypothetical protein